MSSILTGSTIKKQMKSTIKCTSCLMAITLQCAVSCRNEPRTFEHWWGKHGEDELLTAIEVTALSGATAIQLKRWKVPYVSVGRLKRYMVRDLIGAGVLTKADATHTEPSKVPSWLYFVGTDDVTKIGTTSRLKERFSALQCGAPVALRWHGIMPGDSQDESDLHVRWGRHRRHGEWFKLTDEIQRFIRLNCIRT